MEDLTSQIPHPSNVIILSITHLGSLLVQNSIPGYEQIHQKSSLTSLISSLTSKYKDLYPKSYNLSNDSDCSILFSILKDDPTKRFIVKIDAENSNQGSSTKLLDEEIKSLIFEGINKSEDCNSQKRQRLNILVQEYIEESVNYKNHKMDFRIYFIVDHRGKNKSIHFYDGFGRVAVKSLDESKNDKDGSGVNYSYLTNLSSSFGYAKKMKIDKISGEKIEDFLVKNYKEINIYLFKNYQIRFYEQIKQLKSIIREVIRNSKLSENYSNSFQLFAADFGVSSKSKKPFLMEINAFPEIVDNSPKKNKIYSNLVKNLVSFIKEKTSLTRQLLREQIEEGSINHEAILKTDDYEFSGNRDLQVESNQSVKEGEMILQSPAEIKLESVQQQSTIKTRRVLKRNLGSTGNSVVLVNCFTGFGEKSLVQSIQYSAAIPSQDECSEILAKKRADYTLSKLVEANKNA